MDGENFFLNTVEGKIYAIYYSPTGNKKPNANVIIVSPFAEELNRFLLKAKVPDNTKWQVTWGTQSKIYTAEDLQKGINLAWEFPENPFCEAIDRVDRAVAEKQAYETVQVKKIFHGSEGKADFEAAVERTEAIRQPLADAIAKAMKPVTHTLEIREVTADE